ncbi:MAG TPA: methyltransferase domain-containing protein [Acidimicrobiales bacterium]|nr:methyltransferase domain-containing protein [Acidimicrobiales bacterium]
MDPDPAGLEASADVEANAFERRRWNDERWTRVWPRRERLTRAVTPFLLDAAELRPGERVLEIGSGAGAATLDIWREVTPGGRVVAADISAPLTTIAAQRAREAGAANVTFAVADVQREALAGGPFDAALSQFGVMFFDEPQTAFANVARHLRADGRLAFVCWQPVHANPWYLPAALEPLLPPPPPPAPGKSPTGPFALADATRVVSLLGRAGFRDVEVRPQELVVELDPDDLVDDDQLRFMGIPEERLGEATAIVERHLAAFELRPAGRALPLAFFLVRGRRASP